MIVRKVRATLLKSIVHNVDLVGGEKSPPSMKTIRVEVKTQTLMYSKNIVSFPQRKSQIDNLLNKDWVYFIGTGDYKVKPTIGHTREGEIIRAPAKKIYEWLTKDGKKYYTNPDNIKTSKDGIWYNIPQNLPWLKKVGTLPDVWKERFRHLGNTNWENKHYRTKKYFDKNTMNKKGTLGEEAMREYFEKQPSVKKVTMNENPYGGYDLSVDYIPEKI